MVAYRRASEAISLRRAARNASPCTAFGNRSAGGRHIASVEAVAMIAPRAAFRALSFYRRHHVMTRSYRSTQPQDLFGCRECGAGSVLGMSGHDGSPDEGGERR
jgi:hypothetical protein